MKAFVHLRFRYRLLLYIATVLVSVLTIWCVVIKPVQDRVMIPLYVIAALLLTVSVFYLVRDIHYVRVRIVLPMIDRNRYTHKMRSDYGFRTLILTVPGLAGNIVFASMNAVNGILGHSAWFGSLAAYYMLLSLMRIGVVFQQRCIKTIDNEKERKSKEIKLYYRNSVLLIMMAWVLLGLLILLELSKGGKEYPGFTIYVMAAYVFYRFIISGLHLIKVRKENSPMLTMLKRIGTIDASVSMLTLQTAMFAAFPGSSARFQKMINGIVGLAICLIVISFGVHGIYRCKKEQGSTNDSYISG